MGSLPELCEGIDLRIVNKRVLESLVKSGAADSLASGARRRIRRRLLGSARLRLLAALDGAVEQECRVQRDKDLGQADLFGGS